MFWFVVTRSYYPTVAFAVIVTVSLMPASALVAYVYRLVLISRYRRAPPPTFATPEGGVPRRDRLQTRTVRG